MSDGLSNVEIVQDTMDAFNDRDFLRVTKWLSEDLEFTEVANGRTFRGPAGSLEEYENWARAFPDGRTEVQNLQACGDWVFVEHIVKGTNTGPMPGPDGTEIPPTNAYIEIPSCDVIHLKDGQVIEGRTYFDLYAVKQKLGEI